jgi:hypothetical protein
VAAVIVVVSVAHAAVAVIVAETVVVSAAAVVVNFRFNQSKNEGPGNWPFFLREIFKSFNLIFIILKNIKYSNTQAQ